MNIGSDSAGDWRRYYADVTRQNNRLRVDEDSQTGEPQEELGERSCHERNRFLSLESS